MVKILLVTLVIDNRVMRGFIANVLICKCRQVRLGTATFRYTHLSNLKHTHNSLEHDIGELVPSLEKRHDDAARGVDDDNDQTEQLQYHVN